LGQISVPDFFARNLQKFNPLKYKSTAIDTTKGQESRSKNMETQHEDFNKIYQACLQGILAHAATNNGSLMALSQDTLLGPGDA
jgi:hypothetical protein